MAILKIKESRINAADPLLREDPFELFTLENYDPPRPRVSDSGSRSSRPSRNAGANQEHSPASDDFPCPSRSGSDRPPMLLRRWVGLFVSAAIAIAAGVATWNLLRSDAPDAEKPYAYFEIRVIDGNGHPVAGAVVRNGGRKVGTTDSFGEWRRYMKVTLGSTVSLGFNKRSASENLAAIKNFAVPATLPAERDLGIKGTVQVMREADFLAVNDLREVKGRTPAERIGEPSPAEMVASTNSAAPSSSSSSGASAAKMGAVTASDEMVTDHGAGSTTVTERPIESPTEQRSVGDYNVVSISADPASVEGAAAVAVAEAMKQRAQELGLTVVSDARWSITVKGLLARPAAGQVTSGGLFMVRSALRGVAGTDAMFLRNFESDPRVSARGALWILSMHVQKDYPVSGRTGAWTVGESAVARSLFSLTPGKTLLSSSGRVFTVSSEAIMVGAKKSYVLNPPDIKPCADGVDPCHIYSPGLASAPPVATWQRLQLRAVGLQRPETQIFVSGYAANPVGRGIWEYWGAAGLPANVTVVVDGKLTHRTKIAQKAGTPAQLFVPAMGVSRRG